MSKTGWLINDCLTCIPNTKTFWHFLLDSIDGLQDKTGGYTNFSFLAQNIEKNLAFDSPDYIIRNATFFRTIRSHIPTISLLQDPYPVDSVLFNNQLDVCNNSDFVVYNSEYTKNLYSNFISTPSEVIELGTDSSLFKQTNFDKKSDTIIYIGSTNEEFKRFSMILNLIEKTNYNFILVMKDDFIMNNPRVKVYNKINQAKLSTLINQSDVLVCTSNKETLHLAGIEAMFCNVPVVAPDVGIYSKIKKQEGWGKIVDKPNFSCYNRAIKEVLNSANNPRKVMEENNLSIDHCCLRWKNLINNLMEKK